MGFLESVGYLVAIIGMLMVIFIVMRLFPFCSTVAIVFTLNQLVIVGMAISFSSAGSVAHFIAFVVYLVAIILSLASDMFYLEGAIDRGDSFKELIFK